MHHFQSQLQQRHILVKQFLVMVLMYELKIGILEQLSQAQVVPQYLVQTTKSSVNCMVVTLVAQVKQAIGMESFRSHLQLALLRILTQLEQGVLQSAHFPELG